MKRREPGTAVSDGSLSASGLPLPAVLSSCHQAISHGQLEISLSPRSVLVSAGLPGTHTVRTSSAEASPRQRRQKDVEGSHFKQQVERSNQHARWRIPVLGWLGLFQVREFNLRPSQGGITQDVIPQHILYAHSLLSTVKGAMGHTKETKGMVSAFKNLIFQLGTQNNTFVRRKHKATCKQVQINMVQTEYISAEETEKNKIRAKWDQLERAGRPKHSMLGIKTLPSSPTFPAAPSQEADLSQSDRSSVS